MVKLPDYLFIILHYMLPYHTTYYTLFINVLKLIQISVISRKLRRATGNTDIHSTTAIPFSMCKSTTLYNILKIIETTLIYCKVL